MTNHDVVKKLIGSITPIGESNEDEKRYNNLIGLCHLVEMLLMDIDDVVARNSNAQEASVRKIANYAAHFIKDITKEFTKTPV